MTTTIKTCPFCNNIPEVKSNKIREWDKDIWTFIKCRMCSVSPMVSGVAYAGYFTDKSEFVRTKTDEEATQESLLRAAASWNRRDGVDE